MKTPQDNQKHRTLFSLPPIKESSETAVAVVTMPQQKRVTGDEEVDAVLWLREVISTGQADLIAKAKKAATKIKTPAKELEERYRAYVTRTNPGNFFAALSSFGFADLDRHASNVVERAQRRYEAEARFGGGNLIFDDTPAEKFCIKALKGLRKPKGKWELDAEQVDKRFDALVSERPAALLDCVYELAHWHDLYWLRHAVGNGGDTIDQVNARQDYVFRLMSRIRPRDADESAAVLNYLTEFDGMDREHTVPIMFNLIGCPMPYKAKRDKK